MDPNRRS
jgi:hypothetical protein